MPHSQSFAFLPTGYFISRLTPQQMLHLNLKLTEDFIMMKMNSDMKKQGRTTNFYAVNMVKVILSLVEMFKERIQKERKIKLLNKWGGNNFLRNNIAVDKYYSKYLDIHVIKKKVLIIKLSNNIT